MIDSVPYEYTIECLTKGGWPVEVVRRALPQHHYFHIRAPFGKDFNLNDPHNAPYCDIMFDELLRRYARNPDVSGCGGLPAIGRSCAVGHQEQLIAFLKKHFLQLMQADPTHVSRRAGFPVELLTTLPCQGYRHRCA